MYSKYRDQDLNTRSVREVFRIRRVRFREVGVHVLLYYYYTRLCIETHACRDITMSHTVFPQNRH